MSVEEGCIFSMSCNVNVFYNSRDGAQYRPLGYERVDLPLDKLRARDFMLRLGDH